MTPPSHIRSRHQHSTSPCGIGHGQRTDKAHDPSAATGDQSIIGLGYVDEPFAPGGGSRPRGRIAPAALAAGDTRLCPPGVDPCVRGNGARRARAMPSVCRPSRGKPRLCAGDDRVLLAPAEGSSTRDQIAAAAGCSADVAQGVAKTLGQPSPDRPWLSPRVPRAQLARAQLATRRAPLRAMSTGPKGRDRGGR
jgi:hypothetical protein